MQLLIFFLKKLFIKSVQYFCAVFLWFSLEFLSFLTNRLWKQIITCGYDQFKFANEFVKRNEINEINKINTLYAG